MEVVAGSFGYTRIWAVCLVFPEFLAMSSSVFRLLYRYRRGIIWWDDIVALIALVVALPFFFTTYVMLLDPPLSPSTRVFLTWMMQITFNTSESATRISWALSIARVVPPQNTIFKTLNNLAIVFGFFWVGTIASLAMMCTGDSSWRNHPPYLCPATPSGAAFPFASAIGADLTLALIPLRLFWNVHLPNAARRLILTGFTAGSIVVPSAMVAVTACMLPNGHFTPAGVIDEYLCMHIALICCFIGCNTLVMLTYCYQLWYRSNPEVLDQISAISNPPNIVFAFTSGSNSPDVVPTSSGNPQNNSTALNQLAEHFSELTTLSTGPYLRSEIGSWNANFSLESRKRSI